MNTFKESSDNLRPDSIETVRHLISHSELPDNVHDSAQHALTDLAIAREGTPEYSNILAYINYLIKLPWDRKTVDRTDFTGPDTSLISSIQCPAHVKDKIVKHLSSVVLNNNARTRILVVDDEKIALKNLARLLTKEGYEVVTCDNGAHAIQQLRETEFDIIMTDLRMADIDGIQVLEQSKNLCPKARVILITGYATTETAVEAMRKGAFHYIVKPVQMDELRLIIREALGHNGTVQRPSPVLCLTGPAETNKVTAGKSIAKLLGRECIEIPLEHVKDESNILGQSRRQGGLFPGCIMKNILLSGSSNPVLILSGLDRLSKDLAPLLHDVLQNMRTRDFVDRYLEVPFDLTHVIFIGTAENAASIPPPLIENMEVVEL